MSISWYGNQQTMKKEMMTIIVLMTFFCVLLGGFGRPLAAAAVEVDGPATGWSL